MAIRSKRGGAASTRAAKAKSNSSASTRKKAGARKKAVARKRKKSAVSGGKKKKAARKKKGTDKKSASTKRRTGASSRSPRAKHPAAIAKLYPERIGTVLHYYAQAGGAVVQLERGEVQLGDAVHFRGHTTDFYERVEELKLDDRTVEIARAGQTVGFRVSRTVRENDGVYLLSESVGGVTAQR
jgi:putative protease